MSTKPYNPTIFIPRAEYSGPWLDFLADNAPFMTDAEIERLELSLRHTGSAVHIASSAGEFGIEVVK